MITISGYSDDIVSIDADDGSGDELDDCAQQTERVIMVGGDDGGLVVCVTYAPGDKATWRIAVDLVDEDVPIPWPVRITNGDRGYTPALVIECPPGTPWKQIKGKRR